LLWENNELILGIIHEPAGTEFCTTITVRMFITDKCFHYI